MKNEKKKNLETRFIVVCLNKGLVEGAGDFATAGEANDFFKAKTGMMYGDVRLENSDWAGSVITIGTVNEPVKIGDPLEMDFPDAVKVIDQMITSIRLTERQWLSIMSFTKGMGLPSTQEELANTGLALDEAAGRLEEVKQAFIEMDRENRLGDE